jgi:hypothetical protein
LDFERTDLVLGSPTTDSDNFLGVGTCTRVGAGIDWRLALPLNAVGRYARFTVHTKPAHTPRRPTQIDATLTIGEDAQRTEAKNAFQPGHASYLDPHAH